MKIKIRYEKELTTFELNLSDIKGWLNIDLQPDESEEEFGFNNYFVWFYLLIVIDKIMVKLYKEFCDIRVELI
ncbi:TPA: hypothetical protein TVL14_001903 [Streptococcus equi subsp. zooepidemicus]|nr:hypothetical protein [Streptococcus equi subsp. zooepidemicus]HEL1033507.1 hypothetical protein [Streptococcus equi subsp. zooepidemicus]HEL1081996.1 hypothetical protein [Streptococcus equi subsp. zooepidemicus]HEL1083728.1 hypothetical protein [Streptococcus equi subsp. zooepidemicus]HEL1177495.1 hypothetical protein [Streptococcus equi subsp. zooepidemicus]